jgi:uncharacterized membrane protein YfcA
VIQARVVLLSLLAILALALLVTWWGHLRGRFAFPSWLETVIGFVTNFFDTLGIGSFAPTTSAYRLKGLVPDEQIPGTLNVGHSLPVVVQAFIFVSIVAVETTTLVVLIVAAVLGAWLGVGIVTRWPRRRIQMGMGLGLLVAGAIMILTNVGEMRGAPIFAGGEALGLEGPVLWGAAAVTFFLGALVTLGIGLYAPCLIMISLLGMNPRTAFPIMMGACAFLMPVASIRFIRAGSYAVRPALGLALGGIPAVLLAAYIVKELPLTWVRWLVVVVVVYTAISLLRSARKT